MKPLDLPPEPGTVGDPDFGIPGDAEPYDGDPTDADYVVDRDHTLYSDDDEPDQLDGEVDPEAHDDGLLEPEDDTP